MGQSVEQTASAAGHLKQARARPAVHPGVSSILFKRSRRIGQFAAFYFAYVIFGGLGLLTSLVSFALSFVFTSAWAHRAGQWMIHLLFRFFVWYVTSCGLLRLKAEGLQGLSTGGNLILAANHPSLLDAVFIAAHMPNLFCLMKAKVLHNLVLCGQAKLAGYVNNKSGLGLVKACQSRMGEGSCLLVFPEGTRTIGRLGAFKMGFALVASVTKAPIQTLVIEYDANFLGKEWPFFRPPQFPLRCSIRVGKRFLPTGHENLRALGSAVEAYFGGQFRAEASGGSK